MDDKELQPSSAINPTSKPLILPEYEPVLKALQDFLDALPHQYGEALKKGKAYGNLQSQKNINDETPLSHIQGLMSLLRNELKIDRDKDLEIVNAMFVSIDTSLKAIDNRCKSLNDDTLRILLLTLGYVLQYEKQNIERTLRPKRQ